MKKISQNFGYFIPELREVIIQYGCKLTEKPPYVIVGKYISKSKGTTMGIIAASNNEFHAYLLRKEISKSGFCKIQRTEYFPDKSKIEFSIQEYIKQMRSKMEKISAKD